MVDAWPLPKTGLKTPRDRFRSRFPMYDELIEIAIYENIPPETLCSEMFLSSLENHAERPYDWSWTTEELRVARAVSGEFPDRAISMFNLLHLNQTSVHQLVCLDGPLAFLAVI